MGWNVSDWNYLNAKNENIQFYNSEFVLISEIGIYAKHNHKGYGPKLLQSIIFSFPSGTRFGAEINIENNAEIDVFGTIGFVIKRNENNAFYMTLISEYTNDDVINFEKKSLLKKKKKRNESFKKKKKKKKKS